MIKNSDTVVTYVKRSIGRAEKSKCLAEKRKKL